jgi:hypothetical protein
MIVLDGRDYVGVLAVKSYTDTMHYFTSCVYEHDNRDIIGRTTYLYIPPRGEARDIT